MKSFVFIRLIINLMFITMLIFCGCSKIPENRAEVIRVGNTAITQSEYKQALEIAKSAYSYKALQKQSVVNQIQQDVVSELIEELIFRERARELNIVVSDKELESEINHIRKDFPEDTFEKMFIKQSINFKTWKERLRIRLLMQKVTEIELENKEEVTPEEIHYFLSEQPGRFKINPPGTKQPKSPSKNDDDVDIEAIKKYIRQQNSIDSYKIWLTNLKDKYGVNINKDLL